VSARATTTTEPQADPTPPAGAVAGRSTYPPSPWANNPHWCSQGGPVHLLDGRPVQFGKSMRVRKNPRRPEYGWHNVAPVHYLDTGATELLSVTQINKRCRPAGGAA
jgi:hypothetical protein